MQNYSVNKWLRKIMSIFTIQTSILVVTCSITLAHDNYAQVLDREVTVSLKEVTFKNALIEIEKVAHIKFVYSDEQMPLTTFVSLTVERKKLNELLTELLQPYGIYFEADNNTEFIVLKRAKKKNYSNESMREGDLQSAKEESKYTNVSGTVSDEVTGYPLAGVNVIIKGTTNGASTDANGHYVINAEGADILVFSFIGYVSQEVSINGRTIIDIGLKEEVKSLNEVVVNAGYWNVKERENTGNISKISSEDISKQTTSNPLNAIQGRMPGVYIQQTTGLPGGGINIQIRGRNSLRAGINDNGNLPLYIVDGVPYPSTSVMSYTTSYQNINGGNPLSALNPNDIESIEVLKDADATAIYGSRGSNGVVIVTTKKGKNQRTTVSADFQSGLGKSSNQSKLLSTSDYLQMRKEALKNDGLWPLDPSLYEFVPDLFNWDTTRSTNWRKELLGGTAHFLNSQVSISGGNASTQFSLGGSFYRETTVYPSSLGYRKGSGRLNVNHTSDDKKFNVSLSVNYVADKNNLMQADLTTSSATLPPNAPSVYLDNGELNWQQSTWENPVASLNRKYESSTGNLISNTTFSYEFIKGLSAKVSLGYNSIGTNELVTGPRSAQNPATFTTRTSLTANTNVKTWIVEPMLSYDVQKGNARLSAIVGSTLQDTKRSSTAFTAFGFSSDALIQNIQSATDIIASSVSQSDYRYGALFGRANITWDQKYILNFTGRRDGSSRFGPDKQFANFGAVGFAWIFSNENIFRNLFSFGKLRTSYGITGSDQIPDYGYLNSYSTTRYPYNNVSGLVPTRLSNPDFSWETNKKLEVGLEIGVLKDAIFLSSSWYHNRSSNQLVGYNLPVITGFTSIQYNLPAVVQNTGIEFDLRTSLMTGRKFSWNASANLTIPKNKLVSYPGLEGSPYANTYAVGESLFIRKLYQYTGVDPNTGLYTVKDVDDNGIIDVTDRTAIKFVGQRYYGGINNTLKLKEFSLDFLFQFVKQSYFDYQIFYQAPGANPTTQPDVVMTRWQKPGDVTDVQKLSLIDGQVLDAFARRTESDAAIVDASFIRLRSVSLSWNISAKYISRVHLRSAKLYLQGQNLITFTNYFTDPEVLSPFALPPLKVYTAGLKLEF